MTDLSCQQLVQKLFKSTQATDQLLEDLKKRAQLINNKYEPRRQFNRWRNSDEGKQWKKNKWKSQKGCCAICCQKILLKGSHIDHIKPISKHPQLALETENMQVTCADCNLSKNDQV